MKKIARVIAYALLLCLMVTEISGVAEIIAAERESQNSIYQESIDENKNVEKQKNVFEEDDVIFKHLDKENFKNGKHISRLENEEKLNTYVFKNEDGSQTVYYMYENVKYTDKDGKIKDKDISLVKKNKGYGIVQNEVDLFLPENPSDGVTVNYSGYDVTIIPQGGNGKVKAKQCNDAIIYDEYFGKNASLKYTPLLSGVKEDIILKAYEKDVSYDFVIETNGLYIYNDNIGYYLADETNTTIIYYLGDVEVYDAIGKPELGEMEVTVLEEGQRYKLTLSVSDTFLSDSETVYPVTIDPTITISDTATGADSIIDAPIFELKPTTNYAKYKYNTVGTTTASYGVGRTVVKLPGLTSSNEYQSINASQIKSVKFYVRDSSGTGKQTINLYPLTNTTWTETTVNWKNVGSYVEDDNYSAILSSGKVTGFDITGLVKYWKTGKYSANAGFILINSTETKNKSFCSSEYGTTSYRPYVEMTYEEDFSLSVYSTDVIEDRTVTITATTKPSGLKVMWNVADKSIATINSSSNTTCEVRGVNAGHTILTATIINADGETIQKECSIYVRIENGVYLIQNVNSNMCLQVKNGGIKNATDVIQAPKMAESMTVITRLREMWKVYYIGNGRYSIRPMNKLNMGLDVTANNVDIWDLGTIDNLDEIESFGEWTIEKDTSGYIFKNNGLTEKTMQIKNASVVGNATVVISNYSDSLNCQWNLSKIQYLQSGVYWYDTINDTVLGTTTETKYIDSGSASNYKELGIVPILYSTSSINQTFTWISEDDSIATVDNNSGMISATNAGNVVIRATSVYGSLNLHLNLQVKSSDPFHPLNIQYMRYVRITGTNVSGTKTDHTISIVKSKLYSNDYCIIHDNIYQGYYRTFSIDDELTTTLENLEAGYQEHYNVLPKLDTSSVEEGAAHSSKKETDQLVEKGYISKKSSEYYGVWAFNYVSTLNLLDHWKGIIDATTTAYSVYLSATLFYYSYLMATNTIGIQLTSSQYNNVSAVIDDIDDAINGMAVSNRTVLSSEARNATLAQAGYTNPLPYKPQTPVVQYQQVGASQYVRVFTEGNKTGRWLMKYSDIQGLTPAQIQSKFALPTKPTHYCFVEVPAGTTVYVGVVNRSSISGTLQYELGTQIPKEAFGIDILLP